MSQLDFIHDLKAMGLAVEDLGEGRIAFPFEIPCGSKVGLQLKLGLQVPADWPLTSPSGPHLSVQLHPIQGGGLHPTGGIHQSPFGTTWQYWSRPYVNWRPQAKPVRQYLAHINHLFETQ